MSGDTFTNILVQNQLLVTGQTKTSGIQDNGTIQATNLTVANPTQNYAKVISFAATGPQACTPSATAVYSATPVAPTRGTPFISVNASTGVFSNITGGTIAVLAILNCNLIASASSNTSYGTCFMNLASGAGNSNQVPLVDGSATTIDWSNVFLWSSTDTFTTAFSQSSGSTGSIQPNITFILL